jgi:hypothetical protein
MVFQVFIKNEIEKDARILIPLSIIGKKECTGERLKALISFFKSYNTTLLIADGLQKYNMNGNEKEALKKGDKFIDNNSETLKGIVTINDKEAWDKYKDTLEMKLIRWNT